MKTSPPPPPPPKNEILFRITKIADIAYIAVVYFVVAIVLGYYIDKFFVYLYGTDYDKKSNLVLSLEVLSQITLIAIMVYIGRNLVELLPSPLHGVAGLDHQRVKELKSGAFMTVFLVMFQFCFKPTFGRFEAKYPNSSDSRCSSSASCNMECRTS